MWNIRRLYLIQTAGYWKCKARFHWNGPRQKWADRARRLHNILPKAGLRGFRKPSPQNVPRIRCRRRRIACMELYESRIASMQRFVAMTVMFHQVRYLFESVHWCGDYNENKRLLSLSQSNQDGITRAIILSQDLVWAAWISNGPNPQHHENRHHCITRQRCWRSGENGWVTPNNKNWSVCSVDITHLETMEVGSARGEQKGGWYVIYSSRIESTWGRFQPIRQGAAFYLHSILASWFADYYYNNVIRQWCSYGTILQGDYFKPLAPGFIA